MVALTSSELFKLKAEVAPALSGPISKVNPFASIRVDTGVFHLDQLYEYKVPEKFDAICQPGVRVQVPFGNKETEGIVVERSDTPSIGGELKSVSRVLSVHPVATRQSLTLIDEVSRVYGCNPWDVIRSAIPSRVSAVDKMLPTANSSSLPFGMGSKDFYCFAPFIAPHRQVQELIEDGLKSGSILIVAPDEKDVDLLVAELSQGAITVLKLTAAMPRSERYLNFLKTLSLEKSIVIGTRSAIFAPIRNLSTIVIYKESSPDHYEIRSPGWNSRDVALLRQKLEGVDLIFTGYAPSLDCSVMIEKREIKFRVSSDAVAVKAYPPSDGALLPGKIFSQIRSALKKGPVLFVAPRKGYGNALMCAHCRNIATCSCGGRLVVTGKNTAPSCVHCAKNHLDWSCTYCGRSKQYLAGRGIDRAAEEISRAFPNIPVIISSENLMKISIESQPSVVLATPGSMPLVDGGYAAVVILEGLRFFSHSDLRSIERARELFMESAALVSHKGQVLIVIDESHPIIWAITRWSIAPLIKRELATLSELSLPPYVSSVLLVMEESDGVATLDGLRRAQTDGRLPQLLQFFGPIPLPKGQVKIVLHATHADSLKVIEFIHELSRRRSMAKKSPLVIRVNPYSL